MKTKRFLFRWSMRRFVSSKKCGWYKEAFTCVGYKIYYCEAYDD